MADTVLGRTRLEPGIGPASPPDVDVPSPASQGASTGAGPASRPARRASSRPALRSTGIALLLLAGLVLGFAAYLYGLSAVQEGRAQAVMYTALRNELASGVAPLGWTTSGQGVTAPGAPVAILDIPAIGIRNMVVVQGTTPQNLTLGPGHLRSSPFPGQPGISVIYGRQATFGAPFARLSQLRPGDRIRLVTGEGWSTYVVAAAADSTKIIKDPAPNRLLLVTASSPVVPTYYLAVDAHLTSAVRGSPGVAPVVDASELPLAGDHSALALTTAMEWALLLAAASAGVVFAALRWSPWAAYLAGAPLILAVLWNLYENLAALLPNVY